MTVRVLELEEQVRTLTAQLRDLMDKLKPPPKKAVESLPPAPGKTPTGKKPGGQPGHPPRLKRRVERVTEWVAFVPTACEKCEAALPPERGADDPDPTWFQVAELPPIKATITEYQGHSRTCACGHVTHHPIPREHCQHSVGPNLAGLMIHLVGVHGVSKRGVEEIVESLFDVPISLGTISNLEQEAAAALAKPYQEVRDAVAAAKVKGVDETGYKQAGKKRWLWVAATLTHVLFSIHAKRNWAALKHLLGTVSGLLISDRWRVYDDWPDDWRQVCWAHLKRNWEKKADRGGTAKRLAGQWQDRQKLIFELWHRFRDGRIDRNTLGEQMAVHIDAVHALLSVGHRSRDAVLARFCGRLLDHFPTLWLFVVEEGVEPTNNHTERVQRSAVLWRRRSFGCHSAAGGVFVERILTVVQTLKVQKRPVLAYLQAALLAHRTNTATPSLLAAPG